MKIFLGVLLLIVISSSSVFACSMIHYFYAYEIQGDEFVYTRKSGYSGKSEIITRIKDADLNQFHAVYPLGKETEPQQKNIWKDDGYYFTDKKNIFWKGERLTNLPDQPQLDIPSFQQADQIPTFAIDKNSIYFLGKRTDNNNNTKKVNLKKLKYVDEYMMSDGSKLYSKGRYMGAAEGYKEIKKSLYGSPGVSCEVGYFIIAANDKNIFINGEILPLVDVKTFAIKRWMPNFLLDYSDKNGISTYAYGKTKEELENILRNTNFSNKGFYLTRDKVLYVTKGSNYNEKQRDKYIVPIEGLDPEKVRKINSRTITQDGQTLYVLEGDLDSYYGNKDLTLRMIRLQNRNIELSGDIIEDKEYFYIIDNRRGLFTFKKSGKFVRLGDYFAQDDEYVYILKQGKRFKTANPKKVHLNSYYNLITEEGYYDTNGNLHANR